MKIDGRYEQAYAALHEVVDPELDEPITELGFVRSLAVDGDTITAHLRLPTSFCSPNFAYLMASDAKDVLTRLEWSTSVTVELDDHHDSHIINVGLRTDAGYRGTFGNEADDSLDALRVAFQRKAHTAAMERCLTELLRSDPDNGPADLAAVRLGDLPAEHPDTAALIRRRHVLALSTEPDALVLVDHTGAQYPEGADVALRRARSTRISIEGNAHFCRGLLRTRYDDAPAAFFPVDTLTAPQA